MAEKTVTLVHGLPTKDDQVHHEVVLRELTAGDIIEASKKAEQLMMTPQGYQLVTSQAVLGVELLRRQIERIGDLDAITDSILNRLHADDFALLQNEAQALGQAAFEVAQRGRDEAAAAGSEEAGDDNQ